MSKMKRKMIECDNCKYKMTEKAYEDLPECPKCHGHYVTGVGMVEFRSLPIGRKFRITGQGPILMRATPEMVMGIYLEGSRRGHAWWPKDFGKLVYPVEDEE